MWLPAIPVLKCAVFAHSVQPIVWLRFLDNKSSSEVTGMNQKERLEKMDQDDRRGLANIVRLLDGSQPIDTHAALCGLRKQYPSEFKAVVKWHLANVEDHTNWVDS